MVFPLFIITPHVLKGQLIALASVSSTLFPSVATQSGFKALNRKGQNNLGED